MYLSCYIKRFVIEETKVREGKLQVLAEQSSGSLWFASFKGRANTDNSVVCRTNGKFDPQQRIIQKPVDMRPNTTFNLKYTSKEKSILEDTEKQIDSLKTWPAILLESYIKSSKE